MKQLFTTSNIIIALMFPAVILGVLIAVLVLPTEKTDTDIKIDTREVMSIPSEAVVGVGNYIETDNPVNPVTPFINFSTSEQRVKHLLLLYKMVGSTSTSWNTELSLKRMEALTRIIGELREEYVLQEAKLYR